MTTKKLSGRQARWAELLSRYSFKLMYRAGKANARADALSRKEGDVQAQDVLKGKHRTQLFLSADKIDPRISQELNLTPVEADMPIEPDSTTPDSTDTAVPLAEGDTASEYDSLQLTDRILTSNRTSPELNELRIKAQKETEDTWQLRDGLLLRYGKLFVTGDNINPGMPLRTALIKEAHEQPLSGHPGRTKLRQLLQSRYYWPNQGKHIDQYCANCHTCRRSHVPRDKKPGLLHPLPVPEHPWQHNKC